MTAKTLIVIFLLISAAALGQTKITGVVTGDDGKPVEYASVLLLKKDSTFYKGDITNKEGRFVIPTDAGDFIVEITILGQQLIHRHVQIIQDQINDLGTLKVTVVKNLSLVTVTGNKPVVQMDMDKLVFHVENSPLNKGYSGLDVLARSPMLQVNPDQTIILRNKTPIVYINGRQLHLSGKDLAAYLTGLNSEMIKSIEIQATGSAESDASASGVVNIILKKPPKGFTSNFTASYTYRRGNIWSDYAGLNTNYGSKKWNFYSKFSYSKDNDYGAFSTTKTFVNDTTSTVANGYFSGNKRSLNALGGIVFYPTSKTEFGVETYYSNVKGHYTTSEDLHVYKSQLYASSTNERSEDFRPAVWYGSAYYSYKIDSLGSLLKLTGDVGRKEDVNNNNTNSNYTYGNFPNSLIHFDIIPASDYYMLQGDLTKKYKKGYQLKTGLKFSSVSRSNVLTTSMYDSSSGWKLTNYGQENFKSRESIFGGYFTFSGKIKTKNAFRIGLRAEYTHFNTHDRVTDSVASRHYVNLFPRFYYGYTVKTGKTLSLSFSRSIQRPSFRDLNPFITKENDYSYIQGNPELKPQYTNSIDVTYSFPKQSVSLYADRTEHLIAGVYTNTGNITYYKPTNFGTQAQYGIDYHYSSDITKWLYTNTSVSAYYYTFKNAWQQASQFSFNSRIYARFKISKTWSADMLNVYNTRFLNYVVKAAPQYRLDVSVQKDIFSARGTIKMSCSDVFNTQRDKNFSTYQNFTLDFYQKRRTQSFTIMFIYNFSNNRQIKNNAVDSNGGDVRNRL